MYIHDGNSPKTKLTIQRDICHMFLPAPPPGLDCFARFKLQETSPPDFILLHFLSGNIITSFHFQLLQRR